METLSSQNLKGIWCSIQLPINRDDSIDYGALLDEIQYLTETSVQGLYSNGTAAEFYNQTESEFDRISEMLASNCHEKKRPFQIGASHMSPIICIERVKRIKALDPAAFQIILPNWMPLNNYEISSFLAKIIEEAAPIPIVLYHPGHARTTLTASDFNRISHEFPGLIGIKTGGGDSDWYKAMRTENSNLAVFVPGHRLATGIKEGVASGSYSNMACLNPDATQKWYEIILSDLEEGLRIEKRILSFFNQYILPLAKSGYSDAALDKLLWSLQGRKTTGLRLRWPYQGIDQKQLEHIRDNARKILPEFF